jgi:hypothetical protein
MTTLIAAPNCPFNYKNYSTNRKQHKIEIQSNENMGEIIDTSLCNLCTIVM